MEPRHINWKLSDWSGIFFELSNRLDPVTNTLVKGSKFILDYDCALTMGIDSLSKPSTMDSNNRLFVAPNRLDFVPND